FLLLVVVLAGCNANNPPKKVGSVAPVTLTASNFNSLVLKSSQPVLVDFWAESCPPCRAMGPIIDHLATEFQGSAVIGKVDVGDDLNENDRLAIRYGIERIPCFMIFSGGREVARFEGMQEKSTLAERLRRLGGTPSAAP